jgi:NAD(P)-dependent dehydrogenase (short-subunit alcohol dehydrogenase family)
VSGRWQLAGRWVILTGGTGGIGLAALEQLAGSGAKLAVVGRNPSRLAEATERLNRLGADTVLGFQADLTLLSEVRMLSEELAEKVPDPAVLVNNAGAIFARFALTAEGHERTWALNHLAPFLLTNLLLERLKAVAPAKVITTSSDAHRGARLDLERIDGPDGFGFAGFGRYSQTKLANILFTAELARRLEGSGVGAYCFHPGFVATGFNRNNGALASLLMTAARPFARSPQDGARTLVWLVERPPEELQSGAYYYDQRVREPARAAQDRKLAAALWRLSAAQAGLGSPEGGDGR